LTEPSLHVTRSVASTRTSVAGAWASVGIAAALVWLAWNNGGYDATVRYGVTIVVWWTLGLGVLLGLLPRARLTQAGLVALELMAALCAWTFASSLWASSAEHVLVEFNRDALYLGVVALALAVARESDLGRVADGLAVGIAVVAMIALASRLFPDPFPTRGIPEFLPGTVTRLSFPLGYWNGLAILTALGVPLLVRGAVSWRSLPMRGLALAPVPAMAAVIYLCSSRGGVIALLVGAMALVVLSADRWPVVAALATAWAGSAAAIYSFHVRPDLVNGPLGTEAVLDQGRTMAIIVAGICAATGALFALASWLIRGRIRIPRALGVAAAVLAVATLVVGMAVAQPQKRFQAFKAFPTFTQADFVNSHLTSGSGTGRWQQWTAAVDAWQEAPVAGIGAGGYKAYWVQHRPADFGFVTDAHSLYLETLGELGLVGFLLLAALLSVLVGAGGIRCGRCPSTERSARAALLAAGLAFLVAAGIDWMWELTVVALVGLIALAAGVASGNPKPRSSWSQRVGVTLTSVVIVAASVVPLATELELEASRRDVRRGDTSGALAHAITARRIAPWAASSLLQIALAAEQERDLVAARAAIELATQRDPDDWLLWVTRSRLETKDGDALEAEESLRKAATLNPRFQLFR